MESFNIYCLPAVAALILKLLLLAATRVMPLRSTEANVFLAFLFTLALHNVSEIMLFNYSGPMEGIIPIRAGFLYFTMSIIAVAILLHLMLVRLDTTTHLDVPVERLKRFLYIPPVALLFILWMTNDMVRGFVPHAYSYTRVPGDLYVLFEFYAIGYLLASISVLVVAAVYSSNRVNRRKNIITLLGMLPMTALPIVVILLQKYGINIFNLLIFFPLALTFFLIIAAYAIYEHRLFNIFFHLPGTRLRRRHTAFHRRITEFLSELDRLPVVSIEDALDRLAAALKCSVALVGGGKEPLQADPAAAMRSGGLNMEKLEEGELDKIDRIVLTKELKREDPEIFAALSGANCAAVIPFRPFKGTSAGWLLLGGARNEPEELPIDFAIVEDLFDRMGDLFLENIVREREQAESVHDQLRDQLELNEQLRSELQRKQAAMEALYSQHIPSCGDESARIELEDLVAGLEKKLITGTLAQLKGNVSATAKALGLTRQTLYAKMDNYGIESSKWREKSRRGRGRRQSRNA
jgi:DNA-binding protein Fis